MENDPNADANSDGAVKDCTQSPPSPEFENGAGGPNNPSGPNGTGDGGNKHQEPPKNFLQRLTLSEWLTFFVGAGTLVVALLTYLNATNTTDLRNAVGGLARLANATTDEDNTMTNELGEMRTQDNRMGDEIQALKTQAENTKLLVKPAVQSANAAVAGVKQQSDNFILDERPIIDIGGDIPQNVMKIPQWVPKDKRFYWNYSIKNFGKTAAYSVVMNTYMSTLGRPFTCVACVKKMEHIVPSDSIWGTDIDDRPNTLIGTPSIAFFDMAILIRISYFDAARHPFYTNICLVQGESGSTQFCDVGVADKIGFDESALPVRMSEPDIQGGLHPGHSKEARSH